MTVKLVILNGNESGVEISLENQRIFSIGTGNESDFFLSRHNLDFSLFFNALNSEKAEWWSNKKIEISSQSGEKLTLSAQKTQISLNTILEVGGRLIGLFSDDALAAKALAAAQPATTPVIENDTEEPLQQKPGVNQSVSVSTSDDRKQDQEKRPEAEDDDTSTESFSLDLPEPGVDLNASSTDNRKEPALSMDPEALLELTNERKNSTQEQQDKELKKDSRKTKGQPKNSKMYYVIRLMPFVIGVLIVAGYIGTQYNTRIHHMPTIKEQQKREKQEVSSNEAPKASVSGSANSSENDPFYREGVSQASTSNDADSGQSRYIERGENTIPPFQNPQSESDRFIASGAEYTTSPSSSWNTVSDAGKSSVNELEVIRKNIAEKNLDIKATKEILFPDEKMMTLIKDMLDTAGAEGIDVRFDRGNYDVFGYVRDDAKWSRIYKILTFDLDLSKVKFSVETSVSLINKFEELLKKFNLSNYVILSLNNSGEIFAKTYYPPALEGLWLTIKNKFEQKYGDYTNIKEYRAHIGWINVVKVSFDQPSYVLLGDGRRIVEGSVIGGDSVLDAVLSDSLRVKSSSSQLKYYIINKPTRDNSNADLSQR